MPGMSGVAGMAVVEVKNQNIFMASPTIQLASSDTRKPLHERDR